MKSESNFHEKRLGQATVAEAAGCSPNTLRAWRARHELCKDTTRGKFRTKYFSFVDVCVVRCVVWLTQSGVPAQTAILFAEGGMRTMLGRLLTKQQDAMAMIGFYGVSGKTVRGRARSFMVSNARIYPNALT